MKPNVLSLVRRFSALIVLGVFASLVGCGASEQPGKSKDFFTSGSQEADQRADQRMAKAEQLKGSNGGGGVLAPKDVNQPFYDRLGGSKGIDLIVDDFIDRALVDPRVNWERKDVTQGGFNFHRSDPVTNWKSTPQNVDVLKKHMSQFLALATGGPVKYEGGEMKQTHAGMHISNAEFDASVGDMKASLDKLQVGAKEQKELLAIIESTRPQIVQDR